MSIDTCEDCWEQVDTDFDGEFYLLTLADGQEINLIRGLCIRCREKKADEFDKYISF